MIKTVKVEEAIGLKLAHDITEIRPGVFKGAAFRQGHTVCGEDVCRLQRLGKNHLYVIELAADEIHENEAAAVLAGALAGEGIVWEDNPPGRKDQPVCGPGRPLDCQCGNPGGLQPGGRGHVCHSPQPHFGPPRGKGGRDQGHPSYHETGGD